MLDSITWGNPLQNHLPEAQACSANLAIADATIHRAQASTRYERSRRRKDRRSNTRAGFRPRVLARHHS